MNRLERLLRPRSVATFGGVQAAAVVEQCLKMDFAGDIWPVHPAKAEVHGVKTFRSVAELPGAPDACFVGVNRFLTLDILRELAEKGAGGAIAFAAGFLEAGDDAEGARLQADLVAAAGAMPVIGPNCYGLINYADGALLWPDQHGGRRLGEGERGAAIITQSSNIACNLTMQKRGLPIAFLMTAGNQAQTGLSEMALGLVEDPRVSCLGLHIEGFDSVSGFERLAARARELKKPVVAMKAGRSEQARAATVSHTASLAGSDAGSDAFLKRLGIARVDTIPAFLETLKLLHAGGPLAGRKLSSMSCSGGEASVMADSAEGRRVFFPSLSAEHRGRVKETLGPLVAVANPLDYHTFIWNAEPAMTATFSAFTAGGFDLNLLVLDFPRTDRCSDADWQTAVNAYEAALKANKARGAIVASMPENLPEEHAEDLLRRGITPLHGIAEAFDAAEAAALIGEAWARPAADPVACIGNRPPLRLDASRRSTSPPFRGGGWAGTLTYILPPVDRGGGGSTRSVETEGGDAKTLTEAEAKDRLHRAGVPVPEGRPAATIEEAVEVAKTLGFPAALKALGVAHKSEAGAVRLNLSTPAEIKAAARNLLPLGQGLLVERMVGGGVAELIVGVTRDPVFGPVMTLGSGGVLVELLQDSATLLLPASRDDIEAALRGLKLFPLLDGFRGRPKADLPAAIDAMAAIARFAAAHADRLEELDVNPLIVCREGQGAWAADALMVVSAPGNAPLWGTREPERSEGSRAGVRSAGEGVAQHPHPSASPTSSPQGGG